MPHYREELPFTLDEWSDDGTRLVQIHGRLGHHDIARAAFEAFAKTCESYITLRLRGQVIRERKPVRLRGTG